MVTVDPPSVASAGLQRELPQAGVGRFVTRARAAVGLRGAVDVLLTDDTTIQRLNRNFRGKNKATDVLSFPAYVRFPKSGAAKHVGDLAISVDTAKRQAREHGHALGDEVRILILHGLLHLAGMDHERDKGEMAAREAELRAELGLVAGLIERATTRKTKAKAGPSAFQPSAQARRVPRSLRDAKAKSKRAARKRVQR